MDDRDPALALNLTLAMARRLGVDLGAAVNEGWFTRKEMEALLASCADCGRDGDCLPWLTAHREARSLPPYCRNKTTIEALSP